MAWESVLLSTAFLHLSEKEFGKERIKINPESISRLAALLELWSLLDEGRIKMEPGFESFWLATRALSLVSDLSSPELMIAKSTIALRGKAQRCMKAWLLPEKIDPRRYPESVVEKALSHLEVARQWARSQENPHLSSVAPRVAVAKGQGQDRFALLDRVLDGSGFWENIEKKLQASGKKDEDFQIAIKANISMILRRSDDGVYTDPLLVRHLLRRLAERGFRNLVILDAQNLYNNFYWNRSVGQIAAWAGYLGYWSSKPAESASVYYDKKQKVNIQIRDMTQEAVEFDFGGNLGRQWLGRTWMEADYRISFAKAKTHHFDYYTLGVKNVFGALPSQNKPLVYHRHRLAETLTAAMIKNFPVHFSLIDAYHTADGCFGAAWQARACKTHTLIASSSLLAADAACAMMMKYDPFISSFFSLTACTIGVEPFQIREGFCFWPGWRRASHLVPFFSHNLEKFIFSPCEISGALFTQGTDPIFRLKHRTTVRIMRFMVPICYVIRILFDPALLGLYANQLKASLLSLFHRNRTPIFRRSYKAKNAFLELSRTERVRLLAILKEAHIPRSASAGFASAEGTEVRWNGQSYAFMTGRSPAALAAVELLRGADSGLWSKDELVHELEFWKNH